MLEDLPELLTALDSTFEIVDFDSSEGQAFTREHRVLSIPTTLVFYGKNSTARIEGYGARAPYLSTLMQHLEPNTQPETRQARGGVEGDKGLQSARELILGGEVESGIAMANHILHEGEKEDAEKAAILIGRYHIRVAGEFENGRLALDAVYHRFGGDVSSGVVYWRGKGLLASGDVEGALGQFKEWESLREGDCRERLRAGFMDHHRLYGMTLTELLETLNQKCEPSASLHFLMGKDLARRGHGEKGKVHFEKAIELAPTRVLYQNELKKPQETSGKKLRQ